MIRRLARLPLRAARRVKRMVMPADDAASAPQACSPVPVAPGVTAAKAAAPAASTPTPAPPKAASSAVPREVEVEVSTTPNPDAMKFTCSVPLIASGSRSFTSAEEASGHDLAEALFEFVGVRTVFIQNSFVTVTKRPQADWPELIQVLEGVIGEVVAQGAGG